VAALDNPPSTFYAQRPGAVKDAARSLGLGLAIVEARTEADFEGAFAKMVQAGAGALLQMPDTIFYTRVGRSWRSPRGTGCRRSTIWARSPKTGA